MLGDQGVETDADVFWLILVLSIVGIITLILIACFDWKGNHRRWLVNRLKKKK